MIHPELMEPYARTVLEALGVGVLEAAALAALVWVMTHIRPQPSATTRHVLWWLTLGSSALLPIVSVATSLGRVEHRTVLVQQPAVLSPLAATRTHAARVGASFRISAPARSTTEATRVLQPETLSPADALLGSLRTLSSLPFFGLALFALWLLGAAVGGFDLARSLLALRRVKRDASLLDERVVKRLRRWRHSARTGRSVALAVSNDVDVPVAVGFRTPTILLPIQVVETEDIADIDQIAMHEYAHLDRYDDWTNLVQRIIERLFWFNPVLLFVGRRISLEREIACDDWVIAQTGRAHRYATCLWKLVEASRLPAKPILAPGALLTPRQITVRIEQLLDARRNALPRLSPLGALGVGFLCIALIVVQVQRAPVVAITEFRAAPPARTAAHVHSPRVAQATHMRVPAPASHPKPIALLAAAQAATVQPLPKPAMQSAPLPAPRFKTATEKHVRVAERLYVVTLPTQPKSSTDVHAPEVNAPAPALAELGKLNLLGERFKHFRVAFDSSHALLADANGGPIDRGMLEHCSGCGLHGIDMHALDLHGLSLQGADLSNTDLRGANLRNARLSGVDLRGAKLDGADLTGAVLSGCDLNGASLKDAKLDGLRLVGTSLRGVDLSGVANLRSLVSGCQGCDLRGLDLHGQDLHGIELVGADLSGANLRGASLANVTFSGVDLRGADLTGSDLRNARLHGCNLRRVTFTNANLSGASLDGSEMSAVRGLHGMRIIIPSNPAEDTSVDTSAIESEVTNEVAALGATLAAYASAEAATAVRDARIIELKKHCPKTDHS